MEAESADRLLLLASHENYLQAMKITYNSLLTSLERADVS